MTGTERISYDCENGTTRPRHDYGRNAECFYREQGIDTVTARRSLSHSYEICSMERTLADCKEHRKKKRIDKRRGCKDQPLLDIPLDHVIIDTLHLLLRIMGVLFSQVIYGLNNLL